MDKNKLLKVSLILGTVGFLLLLLGNVVSLFPQSYDQEYSSWFTRDLRKHTGSRDIEGLVHVDVTGSIDFWVMKSGEFNMIDFATAIGWVAGFALGAGEQYSDILDMLYFKRSVDRFSMGEITAKECLLIFALMQRGQLNDSELQKIIERTVKWTRGR
jgi:uncharacterized membrane protein